MRSYFLMYTLIFYGLCLYARNPFEFADEQLKKYTAIKCEQKEITENSKHKKWKIIETKNENMRLIEDSQGNFRSISL